MSHTEGKFIQKGSFAYELMHDGWRKGEEEFRNRFSFQVWADKDAGETAEDVTRRLVACWNFLEGVKTEEIEEGLISTIDTPVFKRVSKERDDLVKERDELVRVLRDFFLNGYSAGRIEKIGDLLSKYPEAS